MTKRELIEQFVNKLNSGVKYLHLMKEDLSEDEDGADTVSFTDCIVGLEDGSISLAESTLDVHNQEVIYPTIRIDYDDYVLPEQVDVILQRIAEAKTQARPRPTARRRGMV